MKKIFLLTMASLMTVFAMAIGRGNGSTKANAKEFDWDKGVTVPADSLNMWIWYRVPLAPLYEEENPSLTLYLTNPSNVVGSSVDVNMKAEVAGQSESKDYTIAARQYKTYTANAAMLVRMQQTEIYVQLKATGVLKFSAKVFEAADLDETCKDARTLAWNTETTQNPMYSAWWKVNLKPIKDVEGFDAQVTLRNTGSKTLNLKVGQSLDCPSSGTTRREYTLAAGESIVKKIPRDMITSVQPDELYFGVENVESPVSIKVEKVAQPPVPVIPAATLMPGVNLLVTDTIEPMPVGQTLYKISVADMDSLAKYEPEFTYRNAGSTPAHVKIQMAFSRPAFSTSDTEYDLAAGDEEIVVYKKNMLEGMEGVDSIYLLTTVTGDVNFYGRFKHVREGKACKTNIDFNWESGHSQEARTTQWYAIDVTAARDTQKDIIIYVQNLNEVGGATATITASMAFSCPYIDLQEITRTVAANGKAVSRKMPYSTYAMMSDTIFIGIETNQPIKFWADTVPTQTKEPDEACLTAKEFNWEEGELQNAGDTVWYKIGTDSVRKLQNFPTVFIQNYGNAEAVITAELSLECPDSIANQQRTLKIAADGSYSKQLSRNMFENISQDTIYLRVITTQQIKIQVRLTEEAEGASCSSAIPFNWVSGNTQAADANLWYAVDLRDLMKTSNNLKLHLLNKDNETCKGVIQLSYECPLTNAPSIQNFTLAGKAEKTVTIQNSALETLQDSMVYVNLQGNTALRFWADTIVPPHFDTIYADGITLIPLLWDSLYTQSVDTAWYIIPQSEIAKVRELNKTEKQKPVAHLINLGAATTIKAEGAFAFPITKQMMTKSQKLGANQHFKDTVPASTFDQFLNKDSIILRITRPAGAADFQFKAELVKAFTGNTRNDALPLMMNKTFTQAPNTEMWYKLNTGDLKKDKTLYGKSLHVMAKNAGKGDAKVDFEIYEGLLSQTELVEYYTGKHASRTIKKGQSKSHNIPAQIIYAVDSVEFYIKVRTTDSLVASSYFIDYATAAADPAQQQAKLVVPNVDYYLPADTTVWFVACASQFHHRDANGKLIRDYIYTDNCTLQYELEDNAPATVTIMATLQDTLTYKVPVRTRTINKSGTARKGEKLLKDLLNKAMKKASGKIGGDPIDISGFKDQFIDSMIHRYVTKEHTAVYWRVRTTNAVKLRLNMPQATGDGCFNAIPFDWHHGNANQAGKTNWYKVSVDSTMIPDSCDIRLHLDNWSNGVSKSTADLQFTCEQQPTTVNKTIEANGKAWKDISRDYLAHMKWPKNLFIQYTSDSATYMWIELIKHVEPVPHRDTITTFVCYGDTVWDLNSNPHIIESDIVLIDTLFDLVDSVKAQLYDSILVDSIFVRRNPQLYEVADKLTIKRNEVLDVTAADTWLRAQFTAAHNDTLKTVNNITWKYSTDGTNYLDIPTTPLNTEWINVKYVVDLECDDKDSVIYMHLVRDTVKLDTTYCRTFSYEWNGDTYTEATTEPLPNVPFHKTNMADSVAYLQIKLTKLPAIPATVNAEFCGSYEWKVEGFADTTIYDAGTYVRTIECGASNGGDSVVTLNLTVLPAQPAELTVKKCNFYEWELADTTIYNSGDYVYTLECGASNGGDSIVTLHLTIDHPQIDTLPAVAKYGNRLLMIDRNAINLKYNWDLDTLSDMNYVKWYKMKGATPKPEDDEEQLEGRGKYYLTNHKTGEPLVGKFYARIELPASGDDCGFIGTTVVIDCPAPAGAPALMPTLAHPGQDIQVLNLDPEMETIIRVYSTEGLLMNNYSITGQETFTFKAAYAYGYYLVEVRNDSHKVTLRYIVK